MTCKDCVHYEVCKKYEIDIQVNFYEQEFNEQEFINDGICSSFRDKSRLIALPCNVGDTVYYITGIGHNLVTPAKIKEIIIGKDGIKDLYVQGNGHNFENSFDIFFLTREEAEKALKEQKNEGM